MTVTNLTPPVVSGTATRGQTLTTTDGTWSHTFPISFSYQWERCNSGGTGCVDIPGASNPSYTLVDADVGSTIRSRVTATESSGNVLIANPGQLLTVLNGASPGDTVLCRGTHTGKYTLTKSFAAPFVTVQCDTGPNVGRLTQIDTGGQSGYIFNAVTMSAPLSSDKDNGNVFYIHGASADITVQNSTLSGGWDCIKIYCAAPSFAQRIVIQDNDMSGCNEDIIHVDGADSCRIEHNYLHDPVDSGEHNDSCQIQRGNNISILRNHSTWPGGPGSGPNQGFMVSQTSTSQPLTNILIANNLVEHWKGGRALITANLTGPVWIVNNTFQNNADGLDITLAANTQVTSGATIEVWNNIASGCYHDSGGYTSFCDTNWWTGGAQNNAGTNYHTGAPGFVDTVSYELTVSAPARSYGLNRAHTPTVDLDGNARPGSPPVVLGCRV